MRERFLDGWLFKKGIEAPQVDQDETGWEAVTLPHDWDAAPAPDPKAKSGSGGGYARAGIGWYKKSFVLNGKDLKEHLSLLFDGVYMDTQVFLNGKNLGGCVYGYTSFEVPFGDAAREGENLLIVHVDNSRQPGSRWYTGSGIYRNVWLIRHPDVHFALYGVRAVTNGLFYENTRASLILEAVCVNEKEESVFASIEFKLLDAEGSIVSRSSAAVRIPAGGRARACARPEIQNPHLWSCMDPYLYTLQAGISKEGESEGESESIRVGVRTAFFDAKKGFLLNGERVKIKGVCLHHDSGLLGAAFHKEIWRRRLEALLDMGCNGIRSSHNPPAPELLDLCDEMGFLVMDELCDEWLLGKNKNDNYYSESLSYGYAQSFEKDVEKDLLTMLRRDYSHPCVVIWSIGNEIPEQSSKGGERIAAWLLDICHKEDKTRPVTIGCDQIAAPEPIRITEEFMNTADVAGYNYIGRWRERAGIFCEEDHYAHPERPIIGTENSSAGGIRGLYAKEDRPFMGNYASVTMSHEALWRFEASHDFVAGDYIWTGIDYRGEAPWPMRGSISGAIDLAGFKKDTFYYFRSIWNTNERTLHLFPHWNRLPGENDGDFRQVVCYTNCEKVSLYLNGRLVGTKGAYPCPRWGAVENWDDEARRYHPTTNDLHLVWDVPYEPGELLAIGYENGQEVLRKKLVTTGVPARLAAKIWHSEKKKGESPEALIQVEVQALDHNALPVPDANCLVSCITEGSAILVGMDNGDPMDISGHLEGKRKMLAGALLAVIRRTDSGKARVRFLSEGLTQTTIEI